MKNKVQLIGNLGMNPEVVTFESGKELAKFSLATNETYRNASGEKVTDTQWHNLVAFGKTATIVKSYLKKGSEIAVEGKLVTRSYEDKNGSKKYVTEIIVQEVLMLDSKENN
jgi:single-strand DNA-binding protein